MIFVLEYFTESVGVIGIIAGVVACYYLNKAKQLTKGMLSFALRLILAGVFSISFSAAFCVFGVITDSYGGFITLIEDGLKFLGLLLISFGGFKLFGGFKEISKKSKK